MRGGTGTATRCLVAWCVMGYGFGGALFLHVG